MNSQIVPAVLSAGEQDPTQPDENLRRSREADKRRTGNGGQTR